MLSFWYKGLFPVGCCDQWKAIDIGPCFLLQGQSNFPLEGCNYGKNMLLTTLGILETRSHKKRQMLYWVLQFDSQLLQLVILFFMLGHVVEPRNFCK
jgi:hypothetical protein